MTSAGDFHSLAVPGEARYSRRVLPSMAGTVALALDMSSSRMLSTSSICVSYSFADGVHIFRSPDLPGLFVASHDADAAYNDVGPSIQQLLKLDAGIDCYAYPEALLRDFLGARTYEGQVDRTVLTSRRFVLERPAV